MLQLGKNIVCRLCHGNIKQVQSVLSRASSSIEQPSESPAVANEDIKVKEVFVNRNPRNLERLSLAPKDRGWGNGLAYTPGSNFPNREYYHRIYVDKTNSNVTAYLEHYLGRVVFSVSTEDWKIRQHLYKGNDVAACKNIGKLLAERCIRAGISCAHWSMPEEVTETSSTIKAVYDAITETGFALEEPEAINLGHKLPHRHPKGPKPVPFEGITEEKS